MTDIKWYHFYLSYVLVVRKDLKMSTGKIAAQVGHAGNNWILLVLGLYKSSLVRNNLELFLWENYFYSTKIILAVKNELELLEICKMSQELFLVNYLVRDSGKTEIEPDSVTVCGLGPDKSSKIDLLTLKLKLF